MGKGPGPYDFLEQVMFYPFLTFPIYNEEGLNCINVLSLDILSRYRFEGTVSEFLYRAVDILLHDENVFSILQPQVPGCPSKMLLS